MDSHRRPRFIGVSLLMFSCLATVAAGDNQCPACVLSNTQLALAGSFRFPPDPCLTTGESVSLSGNVHVVTKVDPTTFVGNLHLNMAGVNGVGQTSGDLYIGIGSNKRVGIAIPPGPKVFTATFTLEPTNGCASVPLPLKFTLNFNSDGTLNAAASSVSVGGVT